MLDSFPSFSSPAFVFLFVMIQCDCISGVLVFLSCLGDENSLAFLSVCLHSHIHIVFRFWALFLGRDVGTDWSDLPFVYVSERNKRIYIHSI